MRTAFYATTSVGRFKLPGKTEDQAIAWAELRVHQGAFPDLQRVFKQETTRIFSNIEEDFYPPDNPMGVH